MQFFVCGRGHIMEEYSEEGNIMKTRMKSAFLDKLIARLNKLDLGHVQTHFLRLASEKGLLETIFHTIREGIIVLDPEGRIVFANRAVCRLFGETEEGVEGEPLQRYIRDVDWSRVLQLDDSEWGKVLSREVEITYPEHRFFAMYVAPLEFEEGDAAHRGAVVILRDVTEDRRTAAETLESERLNAIMLLAAGVAHEIGNPLNSLNIHLQLMERELRKLPPESSDGMKDLLAVARGEIARLDQIIMQFLRALRPSTPNFERHDLPEILKETLTVLNPELQDRKVLVDVEAPEDLPTVWVDRNNVKQAFFNIVRNAMQAMPDGGVLRILFASDDKKVSVAFKDSGTGIPPERMASLFEPFQTSKSSGTGMGLMIVQRIMRDHGGDITIDSTPKGTTFILSFLRDDQRIRLLPIPADSSPPPPDNN